MTAQDVVRRHQEQCDYSYPHVPEACARFAEVEEAANRKHPYTEEDGLTWFRPGSGEAAIKFLSRYLP
jgi:hypothetical protein